ncbi:MAG TPA: T9SS type A sorting domain-containing protein, partial [Ferruginibacter sp.]|nr:T9SS type A sorting domain-containing protein [Ferruginibacter sp.]
VCVGGTGTALTVTVTATGITQYQWFSNTSPVNSGGTVVATHASSSTADTYTTSTVSASALYYYCKVTTSAGSCNAATSSVSGLFTVTAAPTANAGTALSGICQGSSAVTIGTGASYGGTATSAVWTDGGAGGTFTNNGGTTPSTTTWAPPAAYTGTVTFTLTTAGGSPCSNATATKTMVVTGMPNLYTPPATANYIRYDFTSGSSLVNQGTAGGPAVLGTGTGGSIVQTTDRFGNANSAYLLTPGTGGNYWISNTTAVTLTYVPMSEGIWFKTTVAGGTLLGVNSDAAGANNNPDHNLYMDNAGKIVFDIYNGSIHVAVTSPAAYNDGKWHQAVVTTTTTAPQTITLYVDGASVASTSTTLGLTSAGSRFILAGVNNLTFTLGDNPSNWAFTGSVDDIIVYNGTTLTAAQIAGMSAPSITAVANSCSDAVVTLSSYSLATGTYAVTYNVSGTNTVSSTTATMSFTAGSPGTGTFNTANLPNVGSSNVVNVTALSFSSGSCNATLNINTPNFTTTGSNTWLGSSTNWNDVTNWCGGSVPISTTNVIIPNGLTKYPLLGTAGLSTTGYAGSVSIGTTGTGAAASLTVGTGGLLSISGTITNTGGTFDATAGTIEMAGAAAQSITGANFVSQTIYNLMDSTTSGGLSVDSINIVGELGFPFSGTSSLSISKNVVLLSNASTTAWIGPITEVGGTAQATITGKVIIQRYFPAHRRWRLITASVTAASAQTINAAWQEGVVSTTSPLSNPDPLPGYGTHITGPGHYNFAFGLGYDQSPTNSASIAYVHDTSSWFSLPNTNVTKVTDYQGYMLFVRGSRNYTISTTTQTTLATNATLRTTGSPKTGIQNVPVVAGANVIGNPYAATINFNTIFNKATTKAALGSSTANNTFYLWDPNIASAANVASGTGGWVVLTSNGAGAYIPVPDPRSISPFNVNGDIQSGAAFIVHAQTSGFVQIDESDKVSPAATNNDLYLFRPAEAVPLTMLRTTLYATAADTINYLADGVLNIFDNSFTNDVDWNKDIQKQANLNEQCSVFKGGRLIAVQRSSPVNAGDTIFLKLAHLNQRSYRFAFEATSFNRPDLNAYLIDTFMHTNTPISLGDSATDIDFTITTNAGSAAADRFAITFRPAPGSVQYTTVTATQQNKDVLVQWMVKNQLNIKEYIVEKSTDGTNFYPADTTMATSGSTGAIVYNWLDKDPVIGTNYYRIRNIDNNGVYQESNIAKVEIGKGIIAGIAIYPNPVVNGEIGLQMNNVPTGNYRISVIDETGQVILSETIDHGAASETKNISMYKGVAKGIYILDVQFPDNTQTKIKFVNR